MTVEWDSSNVDVVAIVPLLVCHPDVQVSVLLASVRFPATNTRLYGDLRKIHNAKSDRSTFVNSRVATKRYLVCTSSFKQPLNPLFGYEDYGADLIDPLGVDASLFKSLKALRVKS